MWYAHLKFSHWLPTAVIALLPGLMAEGAQAQTATVTIRAESATGPVAGVRILASDVIGLTNAVSDISERRQAEARRTQSRDMYAGFRSFDHL